MAHSVECMIRFNKCIDNAYDTIQYPCIDGCYDAFGPPVNDFAKYNNCTKGCDAATQDAVDKCFDDCICGEGPRPRPGRRFSEDEKNAFDKVANVEKKVGAINLDLGLGVSSVPTSRWKAIIGTFEVVVGTAELFISIADVIKSVDPVDNNYRVIAQPNPPKPFFIKAQTGTSIDDHVIKAMNEVLENQANALGLDRAIVTSINRAQGAMVDGNETYEKRQMKNARKYAAELAVLVRQGIVLRRTAVTKMRKNGIIFSFTKNKARRARNKLVKDGLPSRVKRIVSRYCANTEDMKEFISVLFSQLNSIGKTDVTFPNILINQKLASTMKKKADALEEFSNSTYINLDYEEKSRRA